jgi:hypothetical protein
MKLQRYWIEARSRERHVERGESFRAGAWTVYSTASDGEPTYTYDREAAISMVTSLQSNLHFSALEFRLMQAAVEVVDLTEDSSLRTGE